MSERRFMATIETIARDLAATLARMGATGARVESGGHLTQIATRHLSRSAIAAIGRVPELLPSGARIAFVRDGRPYAFTCRTYLHPLDNLRAAQRAVTMLWSIYDDYGVSNAGDPGGPGTFDALFGAASAALSGTLLGDGARAWHDVLGVPPGADRATIEAAWRHLTLVNHPDRGGDGKAMARINAARDEGLRQLVVGGAR